MGTDAATRIAILFVALGLASCAGPPESAPEPGPVHFFAEDVRVTVLPGRLLVRGLYAFRNESGETVAMGIRYPFPVDEAHAFPDTIHVSNASLDPTVPLSFTSSESSILWPMEFAPDEEQYVVVEYSQALSDRRATYIVTTTAAWARPIDVAEFRFRVPKNLGQVALSFTPDAVEDRGDTLVYRLSEERYLPETDLQIVW